MSTIKDDGREQVYLERIAISETLDALGGADGYIFHATTFETEIHEGCPMIAQDGPTVLVPPLVTIRTNWGQLRKYMVLFIISCTAFLPDYGSATGAVTLIP